MKLHNYWRSSASYRVRLVLAYKGLPYTYVPVHLMRNGGEQHTDVFKAMNPKAEVPVLEVPSEEGPLFIAQSMAVMEYLEEVFPHKPVLPQKPLLRAYVRQACEMVNAGIQPLQNSSVTQHLSSLGVDTSVWIAHFMSKGLRALEMFAGKHAGVFMVGDAFSMADACLLPQLYSARRFGVSLEYYPALMRVESACAAFHDLASAHPDVQRDAVSSNG
jgi:maleylpyruvate isomerase